MSHLEWWKFQLPGGVAYVPGSTESGARESLRRNSYKDAPVDSWPTVSMVMISREYLVKYLKRKSR